MILAKLYLSPLGAFSKKQLDFAPGMNVVLGPNEAGKSTNVQRCSSCPAGFH